MATAKQRTVVNDSWKTSFGELLEKLSMTQATIIKVEISKGSYLITAVWSASHFHSENTYCLIFDIHILMIFIALMLLLLFSLYTVFF